MVNANDINGKKVAYISFVLYYGFFNINVLPVSSNNFNSITFELNQCLNRFRTIHYEEHPMQRQTIP